jgi:hypothetical protein
MNEKSADIRYLNRHEIDISKWDHCISHASNGLIYARSFYLDIMAENWSALVSGDYDAIMPLTWNKKFGFTYLYQPFFTNPLGVFSKKTTAFDISSFLHSIPATFRYWDIDLNENNMVPVNNNISKLSQYARTNHLLSLADQYDRLKPGYKRLANRMIKKAMDQHLKVSRGEDPAIIIRSYQKDYAVRHHAVPAPVYDKLVKCTRVAFEKKLADTYLAKSPDGEILAYYIILLDENFIYSLIGGSTEQGKRLGAFYLLTDQIIRDHAGTNKTFRFEGSDIPGISFFDELFGPRKISYTHLLLNNLPFPFRFFKK